MIPNGNGGGVPVDDRCEGAEVLAYVCADGPYAPCGACETRGGPVKVFGGSVMVLTGGAPLEQFALRRPKCVELRQAPLIGNEPHEPSRLVVRFAMR